ncbi:MAG: EcsC family protein, partial [Gammaproteobacteria bacterium]
MAHHGYDNAARAELARWQRKMERRPGVLNSATRGLQQRVNGWIPERVHAALTAAIRQMVTGVLAGSNLIASSPLL